MPKQTSTPHTNAVTERSSSGLRDAMFCELDALRSGESTPAKANAVAKLASGIIDTVRMEIAVEKNLSQQTGKPTQKAIGTSIAFGE